MDQHRSSRRFQRERTCVENFDNGRSAGQRQMEPGAATFQMPAKSTTIGTGREKDAKKLRSRHAAQSRRILENTEFDSLARVLPVPRAISSNLLDKASVVRLATSFLKLHRFSVQGQPSWEDEHWLGYPYMSSLWPEFDRHLGTRILEAIDGFLFCLADDGTILYISETVSVGLGLSQIEMIGNAVFDYIHYDDLDAWYPITNRHNQLYSARPWKAISRFKSSLVKRATKDTNESSLGYKVVEFHLSPRYVQLVNMEGGASGDPSCTVGYSGYALPLLCSSMPECRLDRTAFVVTTLLDLRIHYVDAVAEEILLGNKSTPVRGASVYSFVHCQDLHVVETFHKDVLKLGASTSGFFRLLGAKGGCLWTQANAVRVNRVRGRQNHCTIISMLCYAMGLDDFEQTILAPHQLQYAAEQEQQAWTSYDQPH